MWFVISGEYNPDIFTLIVGCLLLRILKTPKQQVRGRKEPLINRW